MCNNKQVMNDKLNSKWRLPPSWIFAQTAITQPPIDVDE